MTHHIKSKSINVQTGEEAITYFTDAEWAAHEQARLDAAAAEAARDLKQELLDTLHPADVAFMKVYADREGLGYNALFNLIKDKMK